MRKKTTKQFIEDACEVHSDRYDYSLVEYKNNSTEVKIICSTHGIFEQKPSSHLTGGNCQKCIGQYMNTDYFIEKSNIKHNNKYDYSLSEYIDAKTEIKIICPTHGMFERKAGYHISGGGCPKCKKNQKLTTQEFIEKSKTIHGDKYDYSLVEYKDTDTNVKIICPIHGVFEQLTYNHLKGHGCRKCRDDSRKTGLDNFIKRSNEIFNYKYDYSLVEYVNSVSPIKIICPVHGIFEYDVKSHLDGFGCKECSYDEKRKSKDTFVEEARMVHSDKYDYSLVEYRTASKKVKIICPIHGDFEQQPHHHLNGSRCPKCRSSKYEDLIGRILDNNNVSYKKQKTFKDCKYIRPLKFDFYLTDYYVLIEFDGKQHFESYYYFGGDKSLKEQQIKDKIKDDYCQKNNIKLYRIKYNENIQKKLDDIFTEIGL